MTRKEALAVALVLALYLGLVGLSLPRQSATFDEGAHLPAGYAALSLGDYRLNPEHPPLVKMWAAAPLLALHPKLELRDDSWLRGRQWRFGHRFLYAWNDADRLLFWSRWPIALLACALLAAIFLWARRHGDTSQAFAALALAALSPDLLAHGQLVTTDVGFALFFFLTVIGFASLVERITWGRVLGTGAALGAAAASKFSVVILPPLLLLLLAAALLRPGSRDRAKLKLAACLVAAGLITWLIVWAVYRFRFAISPDPAASALLDWQQVAPPPGLLRTVTGWVREHRLLPEGYLFGFLQVFRLSETRPAFLAGQLSPQGWWYYFPATFALKTPLALLALLGLGFAARARARGFFAYALWLPVVVYWLITLTRHLNIGHRHLLPIYPFLFIAAGRAVVLARGRIKIAGIALLGLWYASASLRVAPHYLAYFNELAGGPANGYRWLVDSNLDWGQDLRNLKDFLVREGIPRVKLSYFGTADPAYYGIPGELLPGHILPAPSRVTRQVEPGDVLAVSATNLQAVYLEDPRDQALMAFLRTRRPFAQVGYSILLYRADFSWPPPTLAVDGIDEVLLTQTFDAAAQAFAEPLGDADGGVVRRLDEADHALLMESGEGVVEGGPGAFGGVAASPPAPKESPGELEARPAFGVGKADPAHEAAGRPLFDRPHAAAPELPVADQERQVPPGGVAAERRPGAGVAHQLGVGAHRGVVVEVADPEGPQP